jgi:hypothetical protein
VPSCSLRAERVIAMSSAKSMDIDSGAASAPVEALPGDVKDALGDVKVAVDDIARHLQPIVALMQAPGAPPQPFRPRIGSDTSAAAIAALPKPFREATTLRELADELSHFEGAKLYCTLAYTLYTLFFSTDQTADRPDQLCTAHPPTQLPSPHALMASSLALCCAVLCCAVCVQCTCALAAQRLSRTRSSASSTV